jgi:AmiR/NasT family two-component response regulator
LTIRVLVADDQPMVRAGFGMIIGAQPDMELVGEAADGVQAVEMALRLRPDVALMDIRMPRMACRRSWPPVTGWRSPPGPGNGDWSGEPTDGLGRHVRPVGA